MLHLLLQGDNIVVMWIVLIRENVTAGVSGRIDKELKKRLEMMWCQHVCQEGVQRCETYTTTHCDNRDH